MKMVQGDLPHFTGTDDQYGFILQITGSFLAISMAAQEMEEPPWLIAVSCWAFLPVRTAKFVKILK